MGLGQALNPMTDVFLKGKDAQRLRHTQGRPCEDRTDWSDTVYKPGMQRIAVIHQKFLRGKEGFFPKAFRGNKPFPANTWFWTSSLQNWEKIRFFCSKPQSLCYFSSPRKWLQMALIIVNVFVRPLNWQTLIEHIYMPGTLLGVSKRNETCFLPWFLELGLVGGIAM